MKKLLGILLSAIVVMTCACGASDIDSPDPNMITGQDWRTYKGYAIAERTVGDVKENVYYEVVEESGLIRFVADEDEYTVIQDVTLEHGKVYDVMYLYENLKFTDIDDDGIQDIVIPDMVDGKVVAEVFVYGANSGQFIYSELDSYVVTAEMNGEDLSAQSDRVYHSEYDELVRVQNDDNSDSSYFLYDLNFK